MREVLRRDVIHCVGNQQAACVLLEVRLRLISEFLPLLLSHLPKLLLRAGLSAVCCFSCADCLCRSLEHCLDQLLVSVRFRFIRGETSEVPSVERVGPKPATYIVE